MRRSAGFILDTYSLRFPRIPLEKFPQIEEALPRVLVPILVFLFLSTPLFICDITLGRFLSLRFGRYFQSIDKWLFRTANLIARILGCIYFLMASLSTVGFAFVMPTMLYYMISFSSTDFQVLYPETLGGKLYDQLRPLVFYSISIIFLRSSLLIFVVPPTGQTREFDVREDMVTIDRLTRSYRSQVQRQRPESALEYIRRAIDIFERPPLSDRPWLGRRHARLWIETAKIQVSLLRLSDAARAYFNADIIFESGVPNTSLEINVERCELFDSASKLLNFFDEPHDWARDKSGRMAAMLELAPPETSITSPWARMRSHFSSFHANWLGFALETRQLFVVPEILSVIQGRDLAADVLDRLALEAAEDGGTDRALMAYQAARSELRRLAESIRSDRAGDVEFDEDKDGNMRIIGTGGKSALPPGEPNAREAKLLEEYRALHQKLPALREVAAAVPGFEILQAPHRQVTQAWLRASLRPGEAMLLAFIHDGVARAAVLRGDGGGALVDLPAFADKAADMERFSRSVSGRSGLRDGGWSQARDAGSAMTAAANIDRMTEAQMSNFWDETADAQRANLWGPLTEALAGAKRVIGITHGRLQLAALSAGAPAEAKIVQYPGLAFYALARGLYGTRSATEQSAVQHIAVVRGEHADLQYSPVEEQTVTDIWRSAGAEVVASGYPRDGRVSLLHVTSHGTLLADGTPVILMGPDETGDPKTLGERDILRGAAVEAAFLNLCLGGRLSEDPLDGSPSGLVSALMRRGAKVVVAALPPVDDLWACVLGLMVTEAMATDGLPLDRALAAAKKQLGAGVPEKVLRSLMGWHKARIHHVVLNSQARSRRKNPEACAQVALDAALGKKPDPALQSRLTDLLPHLTNILTETPENDRHVAAARFFADSAGNVFADRLSRGPGPAEYGALVHGMIAFGESALAD